VGEVLTSRGRGTQPVDPSTRFDDLGLDSLDLAELFILLEERVGRELDPASANGIETVGELVQLREM
jgi:acyl carrier protein